jgi:GAF domain-containing protein
VVDGQVLARELAEVGRLLDDDDVDGVLARFTTRAEHMIPGCEHATVTVAGADGNLETLAALYVPAVAHRAGETRPWDGPMLDAVRYREPRRVEDVETERRWPGFRSRMRRAGFRSCLALPLPAQRNPNAGFTLFARRPRQFSEHNLDLAILLAVHAGTAFDNVSLYHDSCKLIDNLHVALASRELIGQAQGILMSRDGCDAGVAFDRLRGESQARNVKVRTLAEQVVEAHRGGALDALLSRWASARGPGPDFGGTAVHDAPAVAFRPTEGGEAVAD